MSDERTNFEQRLTDLTPASSIDPGCVMFAAGQASVSADHVASERFWKRWAVSSSVTSLLLVATLAALATSRGFEGSPNLADESGDTDVRLDATAHSDDRPFSGAIQQAANGDVNRARQLPNSKAERASTAHIAEMISQVSPASQFELRRIALAERQEIVPERSRKWSDVNPFRLGDTRRVLAMGTKEASLRRLDTLHPRRPSLAMDVID